MADALLNTIEPASMPFEWLCLPLPCSFGRNRRVAAFHSMNRLVLPLCATLTNYEMYTTNCQLFGTVYVVEMGACIMVCMHKVGACIRNLFLHAPIAAALQVKVNDAQQCIS